MFYYLKYAISFLTEERYSYLYLSKDIIKDDIARKYWSTILKYLDRQPAKHKEDEKYMEDLYNESLDLKIVGIVCPKGDDKAFSSIEIKS